MSKSGSANVDPPPVQNPSSVSSNNNYPELIDYIVDYKIGSGSFASVFKGHHKTSQSIFAIKIVDKRKLNRKLHDNLTLEIDILKKINHPYIVQLFEIIKGKKYVYLIMEYCEGGDLASFVRTREKLVKKEITENVDDLEKEKERDKSKSRRLPIDLIQKLILQLASALECLRSNSLIHRDLKPQNLLLTSKDTLQTNLKIGDFGFARPIESEDLAETLCGSPLYMAPEILSYEKYDAKADLWSVGAIMFEMVTGKPPFRANNHIQLLKKIQTTSMESILRPLKEDLEIPVECVNLLIGLLKKNPIERIGFEEFFMHPFLRLRPLPSKTIPIPIISTAPPEDRHELLAEKMKELQLHSVPNYFRDPSVKKGIPIPRNNAQKNKKGRDVSSLSLIQNLSPPFQRSPSSISTTYRGSSSNYISSLKKLSPTDSLGPPPFSSSSCSSSNKLFPIDPASTPALPLASSSKALSAKLIRRGSESTLPLFSVSTPSSWTYLSPVQTTNIFLDKERKRSKAFGTSGRDTIKENTNVRTGGIGQAKVTALKESVESDYVIVDKSFGSLGGAINSENRNDNKFIKDIISTDLLSRWSNAQFLQKISIPIEGYTSTSITGAPERDDAQSEEEEKKILLKLELSHKLGKLLSEITKKNYEKSLTVRKDYGSDQDLSENSDYISSALVATIATLRLYENALYLLKKTQSMDCSSGTSSTNNPSSYSSVPNTPTGGIFPRQSLPSSIFSSSVSSSFSMSIALTSEGSISSKLTQWLAYIKARFIETFETAEKLTRQIGDPKSSDPKKILEQTHLDSVVYDHIQKEMMRNASVDELLNQNTNALVNYQNIQLLLSILLPDELLPEDDIEDMEGTENSLKNSNLNARRWLHDILQIREISKEDPFYSSLFENYRTVQERIRNLRQKINNSKSSSFSYSANSQLFSA